MDRTSLTIARSVASAATNGHRCRGRRRPLAALAALLLGCCLSGSPIVTTVSAQDRPATEEAADAIAAIDRIIAAIERDFLPERAPTESGPDKLAPADPTCPPTIAVLGELYVGLLEDYKEAAKTMTEAAGALDRSTRYGLRGEGCLKLITLQQRAAIRIMAKIDFEDLFTRATRLADCAPSLRLAAETELAETLNLNRRAILDGQVERARFVRGQSLRMAGELAYLRDRRRRLSTEMAANLSQCGVAIEAYDDAQVTGN